MRYFFLWFILCSSFFSAQVAHKTRSTANISDTVVVDNGKKDSILIFKPTILDYKYRTEFSEYKIFDTVFTAEKTFVFSQFNNKDNFGKVLFPNIGQTFNPLVYEVNSNQNLALLPTGKSFNIINEKEIKYYDVKTPTTSFIYHNSVSTGAVLSSSYTQNVGKNFNFSINYTGIRSKGFYQRNLSANNNVNIAAHYINDTKRYEAFSHFLSQNVNNEENGGIADLNQYLGDDDRFNNRQNLAINLAETQSFFNYKRYYLNHSYGLFKIDDGYPLKLRHKFMYEFNKYSYEQARSESYYVSESNPLISNFPLSTNKHSKKLTNVFSLLFDKEKFKLDAGLIYQNVSTEADHILIDKSINPLKWSESRLGLEGNLEIKLLKKIDLISHAEYTNGNQFGNFVNIKNNLSVAPVKDIMFEGKLNFVSSSPSFNLLMNGSPYQNFNYTYSDFKNQNILEAGGKVKVKWLDASVFANYFNINNYAYINASYKPVQSSSSVNITQFGGDATYSYKKFHFNTKIIVQSVVNNKELLPLPSFVGRANIYYQSKAFKDVAELQGGFKLYYFSKFASREFFPVLNEFVLPGANGYSIGGKPFIDLYINMKVRSMMIFVEAQHFNTSFTKNKAFAAPYYPVADFRLNLGIVWYIFS